ncbi:hypothetical protein ACFXA2_06465 [Micromonospora chalcea]
MTPHPHARTVHHWISLGRYHPYLAAAGGDESKACELYEWSVALTGASFEAFLTVSGKRQVQDGIEVNRLRATGERRDALLADIIEVSRKQGWTEGRYQVFGLTAPGSAGHLTLPTPIPHHSRGRGSAFTQGQRYVVRDRLRRARSTADL